MKKLVIFDLDGTLVDSVKSIAYCGNYSLKKAGFQEIDIEEYNVLTGEGVDVLIKRMLEVCGDEKHEKFDEVKAGYLEKFETGCLHEVKPYDKIKETLIELKNKGIKIAVFSNKLHYNTCKVVEHIFGKDYFDIVLGSKEGFPRKPDPSGALLIAKELAISTEECIYVGDTSTDMKTGTSANMFTVGVEWGFRDVKELEEYGAMKIISSPLQLLDLI